MFVRFTCKIMAVYKISKELLNYLDSCPKDENTGVIIEWNKEEQNEEVKKELLKIISSFSNLVWGYDYNPFKNSLNDKEELIKDIKTVEEWIKNNPNDCNKRGMQNELNALKKQLDENIEVIIYTPMGIVKAHDYEINTLLIHWNIFTQNNELIIAKKEKLVPEICIEPKKEMRDGVTKQIEKLFIKKREIKLKPRLLALYKHLYIKNNQQEKFKGESTSELCKSEELNEIYRVIKSRHGEFPSKKVNFFDGKKENPKKNITDSIQEINKEFEEQKVEPQYCIKQTLENGKGEKFNIALYEINRESE